MTTSQVQRVSEFLICMSCRRLPQDHRAERCREWSAELPAILGDETIHPGFIRAARALSYSVGVAAAAQRLGRTAGRPRRARASGWRDGAIRARSGNLGVRATVGAAIWLVIVFGTVSLLRAFPHPRGWPVVLGLVLAVGFAVFCVADIVRAPEVRYLPKWAWALICVVQIPGGGILYLSIGRGSRSPSLPPGSVHSQ